MRLGISMHIISVVTYIRINELNQVASDPDIKRVLFWKLFKDLSDFVDQMSITSFDGKFRFLQNCILLLF